MVDTTATPALYIICVLYTILWFIYFRKQNSNSTKSGFEKLADFNVLDIWYEQMLFHQKEMHLFSWKL